jgi:hypothetical protein
MDALQVKMVVLGFEMFLLESGAFETAIEQRGLLVGDEALPARQEESLSVT